MYSGGYHVLSTLLCFFFPFKKPLKQDIFDFKLRVFDFVLGFRSTEEGKDVKMMLISPIWSRYDDNGLFNVPQNNYIRIDDYRRAIQVFEKSKFEYMYAWVCEIQRAQRCVESL